MSSKPIAILLAALAGGAADRLTAFVLYRPATPVVILKSIASGWPGKAAFRCGLLAAGPGLVSRFAVTVVFAALFVLTAGQVPVPLKTPLNAGAVFRPASRGS